jgi:probable phosphoglycerate mutase
MELLLIRHARPQRVTDAQGFADPSLDDVGNDQAKRLADYLASEPITALYTSPVLRARETARPLEQLLGLEAVVEPAIAENDVRASHYIPAEDLKAAGDPRWRDGLSTTEWPDYYEALDTFHERIVTGIEGIAARHPDGVVAVYCHSGVIARYTAAVVGLPWEVTGFFYPLYTSITRIGVSGSTSWITTVNETPHLRGTGLPTGAIF